MNSPDGATLAREESAADAGRRRLRFEVIFASVWLAIGLFAVPAMIFGVGSALLGPYGEGGSLGRFYSDFFGDLAEPSVRAWAIVLGPLLLMTLLRLVFLGTDRQSDQPAVRATPQERPQVDEARRIEPRIGAD